MKKIVILLITIGLLGMATITHADNCTLGIKIFITQKILKVGTNNTKVEAFIVRPIWNKMTKVEKIGLLSCLQQVYARSEIRVYDMDLLVSDKDVFTIIKYSLASYTKKNGYNIIK